MTTDTQIGYAKYIVIWVWLIALLVLGSFVPYLPITKLQGILLILGISLVKAVLVSLFFMHLKFERWGAVWMVALFPFFLIGLAVALVLVGNAFAA